MAAPRRSPSPEAKSELVHGRKGTPTPSSSPHSHSPPPAIHWSTPPDPQSQGSPRSSSARSTHQVPATPSPTSPSTHQELTTPPPCSSPPRRPAPSTSDRQSQFSLLSPNSPSSNNTSSRTPPSSSTRKKTSYTTPTSPRESPYENQRYWTKKRLEHLRIRSKTAAERMKFSRGESTAESLFDIQP